MRRALRVPLERWTVELLVEPHRPLLEAELLVLSAAQQAGSLAALVAGSAPPWAVLNALADDGLLTVTDDGSVVPSPALRDASPEHILSAITGAGGVRRVKTTVYRDLCGGGWLAAGAVARSSPPDAGDELHELPARITRSAPGDRIESVEGLARAALPALKRLKAGAPRTLVRRTRVERVSQVEPCVADVTFERVELSDGWEHWLTEADPSLAEVCVRAAPQLVLGRKALPAGRGRWDRGPEVRCLQQCEAVARHLWHRRKERDLTTDKRLLEEIKQIVHCARDAIAAVRGEGPETLRADAARVVPGTGFDQALELEDILRRTRARALLLSSFLSPEFAGEVAGQLEGALPEGARLYCVYGRATDAGISEARAEADAYGARLRACGLTRAVQVVPSAVRTHAKVIVNDVGDVWLGSWNPLSAAPGSEVTEVGVRLGGAAVALAVLSALDGTFDDEARAFAGEMRRAIEGTQGARTLRREPLAEVEAALEWIDRWVPRRLDQQWDQALEERLQVVRNWFCDVTERPRVALVETNEHRDAMLSWIRQADHGVLLATDRIKPAGLDPQLAAALAEQPLKVEQKVRFELRLLWGRESPARVPRDDEDTTAARIQLALLDGAIRRARAASRPTRQAPGAAPTAFAYDLYTDLTRPMRNHAKVLQVDDERLLVTSDNLLVYGDERDATDARELGVVVEAPRQALVLRGELELAHPELRAQWDHTRWRVAYAESVRFCSAHDGTAGVAAGRAAQDMIRRCAGPDGRPDPALFDDMRSRLFETGRGCQKPADALVRLVDIASKNRLIAFDREAYLRVRRDARQRDVTADISGLTVRLPCAARVWSEVEHVEGRAQ